MVCICVCLQELFLKFSVESRKLSFVWPDNTPTHLAVIKVCIISLLYGVDVKGLSQASCSSDTDNSKFYWAKTMMAYTHTHTKTYCFLEQGALPSVSTGTRLWKWAAEHHMNFAVKINVWTLGYMVNNMVKDQWQCFFGHDTAYKKEKEKNPQNLKTANSLHELHITQAIKFNLFIIRASGAIRECDPVQCTVQFDKRQRKHWQECQES